MCQHLPIPARARSHLRARAATSQVRVFHEEHVLGAVVSKVEWSRVQPGADLAAAEAEGLVLRSRRLR